MKPGSDQQSISLTITDMSHDGKGIGHVDGQTIFVQEAVPGDQIEAAIEIQKKNYAVARCLSITGPSPDRIEPSCPFAKHCGGCSLQSYDYQAQLLLKRRQVIDALTRIGHLEEAESLTGPVIGMQDPLHYRSKVQLPVRGTAEKPLIGFYEANSHTVIDADVCEIQPVICDQIRETIRRHINQYRIEPYNEETHTGVLRHVIIRVGFATGDVMVGLILNQKDVSIAENELARQLKQTIEMWSDDQIKNLHLSCFYIGYNMKKTNNIQTSDYLIVSGQPWIEEQIGSIRYRLSPLAFFQVNPVQTEKLFAEIVRLASLTGNEQIWDLYCGTGSISLQLAQKAKQVIGVESVAEAIQDAQTNAQLNQIDNVTFIHGKSEEMATQLVDQGYLPDLVVVDPPRKGCDASLIETLNQIKPDRIIYVSCNPATLARDISLLLPAGYAVQTIQPVDLFPWTLHVETVVLITRVKE